MINNDDYKFIANLVEKFTGIDLGQDSHYLVDARLQILARELGYEGHSQMLNEIKKNTMNQNLQNELVCAVLDAMTTNESLFFRDEKPFTYLTNQIIPELIKKKSGNKNLRIWSAACSTGQEPYSIAISLLENAIQLSDWKIEIRATDVCKRVIERALIGDYTNIEVKRGLSQELLKKYFTQHDRGYRIKDVIRERVKFDYLNLIEPFSNLGTFDIIFCRNVLIYFKTELKKRVLENLYNNLNADGFLILGGAESPNGLTDKFVRTATSEAMVFKKAV